MAAGVFLLIEVYDICQCRPLKNADLLVARGLGSKFSDYEKSPLNPPKSPFFKGGLKGKGFPGNFRF